MKNLQKMGGFAALYSGVALLVAMVGFLLVVGTLDVSDPVQKVAQLVDNQTLLYIFDANLVCDLGNCFCCPGAGAQRAPKDRLACNDADSDRNRAHLGLHSHCKRPGIQPWHGCCC